MNADQTGAGRVLLVAAENDALPGGKVGGIGDVVRDVPPALARLGWEVAVVTPSHGFLHEAPGAQREHEFGIEFGGSAGTAALYLVPGRAPHPGVTQYVMDHPGLRWTGRGQPQIYRSDPPESPFATDATRFALFCQAVAAALESGMFGRITCMHLHDWHAALLLILRAFHPRYASLRGIRAAYTIHNLAIQGVRPLHGHASSLASWYPELPPGGSIPALADPRWPDCVNPMAAGIRLADVVHAVSPSYAEEVLEPSRPPRHYGGEGLEADLLAARGDGRLVGILNGCEYPKQQTPRLGVAALADELRSQVLEWIAEQGPSSCHVVALERLGDLARSAGKVSMTLTGVSRAVEQKMFLLRAEGSSGGSGLDGLLDAVGEHGAFVMLGAGAREYEEFLVAASARRSRLVFLNGYSDRCARLLYASGDLFVMPSSYEPCGISQMLAMRAGQPCLVHAVGGLKDTVRDGVTGFCFGGHSVAEQVDGLAEACRRAARLKADSPGAWSTVVSNASAARFPWDATVREYVSRLYLG